MSTMSTSTSTTQRPARPALRIPRAMGARSHSPLAQGNYRRLARLSGYTPQHVSRVLRGEVGVSLKAAQRIADAAGVSLSDLGAHIARRRA